PSVCLRQTCRAGSAVQSAPIPRRSHRSDSATCCGHSARDSCSSTSVPPRIKATALESQLIHMIQELSGRTLSSEPKCNPPADLIIGMVDQDLRECCHAMLFAFVG